MIEKLKEKKKKKEKSCLLSGFVPAPKGLGLVERLKWRGVRFADCVVKESNVLDPSTATAIARSIPYSIRLFSIQLRIHTHNGFLSSSP